MVMSADDARGIRPRLAITRQVVASAPTQTRLRFWLLCAATLRWWRQPDALRRVRLSAR